MGRFGAGFLIAFALGTSCDHPAPSPSAAPGLTEIEALPQSPTVATREGFLQVLAPLPYETLRITYDVTGPAGIRGTLEIAARPGGFRHERWNLRLPTAAGDIPLEGTMIQTPDGIWSDGIEGAPVMHPSALGPLADAYVALPRSRRDHVVRRINEWHASIARGRETQPGHRQTVLDVQCLVTRVGGHELCVWEETGLPLRYVGSAFQVDAREIRRDTQLADELFTFPDRAARNTTTTQLQDPNRTLESLEAGNYAELALLLQPALRLPTDTTI